MAKYFYLFVPLGFFHFGVWNTIGQKGMYARECQLKIVKWINLTYTMTESMEESCLDLIKLNLSNVPLIFYNLLQ